MNILSIPTDKLLGRLLSENEIDSYIKENEKYLINYSVSDYLNYIQNKIGMTKPEIFRKAEMNEIYGYQIFGGKRTASRDKLLSIAIAMGLTLDEVNKLMKIAGYATLYAKSKRDSIIIYSILNKLTVRELNEMLYDRNELTL